MKKDYIITLSTSILILLLNILILKIVALFFSEEGFALYNIGRRTLSVIVPVFIMGVGLSLTREVAMVANTLLMENKRLLLNAILPVLGVIFLAIIVSFLMPSYTAIILFGDDSLYKFAPAIIVYASGLSLASILQSYFRGRMQFVTSNIINLASVAIIPILCFLLINYKFEYIYYVKGIILISLSIFFYCILLVGQKESLFDSKLIWRHLSYGIPRTPGDFCFYMLFMIPSWWTTRNYGLEIGGHVAFAGTFLNLGVTLISPISYIMLPKASAMYKTCKIDELKNLVLKLITYSSLFSLIVIIFIELSVDIFIELFLGANYLATTDAIRIATIGILPFGIFICLRSIIDAVVKKPLNAYNSILSLLFLICFSLILDMIIDNKLSILIGFVGSLYVLGILSVKDTLIALKNPISNN